MEGDAKFGAYVLHIYKKLIEGGRRGRDACVFHKFGQNTLPKEAMHCENIGTLFFKAQECVKTINSAAYGNGDGAVFPWGEEHGCGMCHGGWGVKGELCSRGRVSYLLSGV